MFRCARCRKVTKPRERMHRVVVETRAMTYRNGGTGVEAVREVGLCKGCQRNFEEFFDHIKATMNRVIPGLFFESSLKRGVHWGSSFQDAKRDYEQWKKQIGLNTGVTPCRTKDE